MRARRCVCYGRIEPERGSHTRGEHTLIDDVGDKTSGSVLLPLARSAAVLRGRDVRSMWSVIRISSTLSLIACASSSPVFTDLMLANKSRAEPMLGILDC